ncbi:MAG: ABC transporter permease [Pseudonocardiales bacterium]|nr:ABC transporter permease [Pseudonocardiales bacterium]
MNLALVYARYQILENIRVPIAVISSAMFPALSLLFFVVPFDYAQEPTSATTAVAQLTVFSVMSSMLFTYGIGIAEERERSWDPYLRTLPAGAQPRIAGRFATGAVFMLLGLVPLLLVGAFGTAATITPTRLLLGIGSLLIAALPFLFGGLAIGYSLSAKTALPVVQIVFFPLAFAGGLLLPPAIFPSWLDTFSLVLPSRGARELVVWASVGTEPNMLALLVFALWIVATAGLAVWAYRRDEGQRFR